MTNVITTLDPMISSGVMAVGTAAGIMIALSLVIFGIWSLFDRLFS